MTAVVAQLAPWVRRAGVRGAGADARTGTADEAAHSVYPEEANDKKKEFRNRLASKR